MTRVIIPTTELRAHHLPSGRDWDSIRKFAMTFDNIAEEAVTQQVEDLWKMGPHSTVIEMRSMFFQQWRRWAHLGGPPDDKTLAQRGLMIDWLGAKLPQS